MHRLTLAGLETAVFIARLGSFTAAANQLGTTQPAISARIRELEQTIGFKLFVRHGRGAEVTLEGRDFLQQAEPLLREIEELANATAQPLIPRTVRLGASSIALGLVARLGCRIRREMPLLSLEVRTGTAGILLDDIDSGRSDLAIVTGQVDEARYFSIPLAANELVWVISPLLYESFREHPLPVLFEKLPIWCIGKGSYSWQTNVAMLSEHGVNLDAVNELPSAVGLTKIVAERGGIGYLSKACAELELSSGLLMILPGLKAGAQVTLSAVCRRDRASHPAIAKILSLAAADGSLALLGL